MKAGIPCRDAVQDDVSAAMARSGDGNLIVNAAVQCSHTR